jgi:hypothetical protein
MQLEQEEVVMRFLKGIARPVCFLICLCCASLGLAATQAPAVKPLDGVNVEALESYQNPKAQQLDFGLSLFPLDPYYNGFAIDVGYSHYYSKTFFWQILNADYVYTVDKGLSSQLAQNYGVNPQSIERLNYLFTSNLGYVHAYGKFIFAKQYIRYFRSSVLIGPAFVASNQEASIGINLGWRFEVFVNNDFSWQLQLRDIYVPSNIGNNLAFVLGTAYGF